MSVSRVSPGSHGKASFIMSILVIALAAFQVPLAMASDDCVDSCMTEWKQKGSTACPAPRDILIVSGCAANCPGADEKTVALVTAAVIENTVNNEHCNTAAPAILIAQSSSGADEDGAPTETLSESSATSTSVESATETNGAGNNAAGAFDSHQAVSSSGEGSDNSTDSETPPAGVTTTIDGAVFAQITPSADSSSGSDSDTDSLSSSATDQNATGSGEVLAFEGEASATSVSTMNSTATIAYTTIASGTGFIVKVINATATSTPKPVALKVSGSVPMKEIVMMASAVVGLVVVLAATM